MDFTRETHKRQTKRNMEENSRGRNERKRLELGRDKMLGARHAALAFIGQGLR